MARRPFAPWSSPSLVDSAAMSGTVLWTKGLACDEVTNDTEAQEWVFSFGATVTLRVASPWRIVADGRIALGRDDDGQKFGLPQPVDAVAQARSLLRGRTVTSFSIASVSADAAIDFGDGLLLEIFNSSSGYEGWLLAEHSGRMLIAQGGGSLVGFPPNKP